MMVVPSQARCGHSLHQLTVHALIGASTDFKRPEGWRPLFARTASAICSLNDPLMVESADLTNWARPLAGVQRNPPVDTSQEEVFSSVPARRQVPWPRIRLNLHTALYVLCS